MRRPTNAILAFLVVAAVAMAAAIGVLAWSTRTSDGSLQRMGPGMMSAERSGAAGASDGFWRSMASTMRSTAVASESEYLATMIAHHQEAITAAGELSRSDRAEMRSFGESIILSQSAQVRAMEGWLQEWYPDQPLETGYHPMMRNLSDLSGDRLDLTFLQDMIGHHMAAVMMSQHLLGRTGVHAEVAQLAEVIRDEQRAEIVQMKRWLAQWFDVDWRAGMGPGRW